MGRSNRNGIGLAAVICLTCDCHVTATLNLIDRSILGSRDSLKRVYRVDPHQETIHLSVGSLRNICEISGLREAIIGCMETF